MNKTARSRAGSDDCTDASKQRASSPRDFDAVAGKHTSIFATLSLTVPLRGPSSTTNSLSLTAGAGVFEIDAHAADKAYEDRRISRRRGAFGSRPGLADDEAKRQRQHPFHRGMPYLA
jgi:hypothetical protein